MKDDVRPPQQARSRESERRILEAALRLIQNRAYSEVSLLEIAAEADLSHGTLYARFRTKGALFDRVHADYCDTVRAVMGGRVSASLSRSGPTPQRVRGAIQAYVEHAYEYRGAVRNFRWAAAEAPAIPERQRQLDGEMLAAMAERASRLDGISPARSALACRMVVAVVRDTLDTGLPVRGATLTQESLYEDVSALALDYLALNPR